MVCSLCREYPGRAPGERQLVVNYEVIIDVWQRVKTDMQVATNGVVDTQKMGYKAYRVRDHIDSKIYAVVEDSIHTPLLNAMERDNDIDNS